MGTIGSPDSVADIFTDTRHNGGQWPQAGLHTQWPGTTGRMGDPVFDGFYASQMQLQTDRFVGEEENARAYAALVDVVGACFVVAHSQAGAYGASPFFYYLKIVKLYSKLHFGEKKSWHL